MNKQIEEMAKDLEATYDYEGCEAWHCGGCEYEKYGKNYFCSSIKQAEHLTAKGYRKASDVAREIFAEIENILSVKIDDVKKNERKAEYLVHSDLMFFYSGLAGAFEKLQEEFAELKKKYESEG